MTLRDSIYEPTAMERRAQVAEILGVGLLRVKQRGTLAANSDLPTNHSGKDSLDSSATRLESSPKSGLTVQDG